MSFQGDVAGIGLGELLQGLARGGRDGILHLFNERVSGCLGVRGGMLYLLPSSDEDEERWRERSLCAWADDPKPLMETRRREAIARAARLETFYRMLETDNLHFRFEQGPLPRSRGGEGDDPYGQGLPVEYMLLEHARLADEGQGTGLRIEDYDVPRAMDPGSFEGSVRDFLEQCDGRSTLLEISDRLGWPLRQTRLHVLQHYAAKTVRLAQPRELLAAAQHELEAGRVGRAASRLSGWVCSSPPGPPTLGDADLLVGEWQRGRLPMAFGRLEAKDARAILRKIDRVHTDRAAMLQRWRRLSDEHKKDELTVLHTAVLNLTATEEPDARTFVDLLRLARSFQESGHPRRTRTLLRIASYQLPSNPQTRIELGRRMLDTGLVEEGVRWLLEVGRELIDSHQAERAIVPIRTVLKKLPDHTHAHGLLIEARALIARQKRRRWKSGVALSIGLLLSLVGFVHLRIRRVESDRLAEIKESINQPEHALELLQRYFPDDHSDRVEVVRGKVYAARRVADEKMRDAWLDRYEGVTQECEYGDPLLGLKRALELADPPSIHEPFAWPTRTQILGVLAARIEARQRELDLSLEASIEELHAEERLLSLLGELVALSKHMKDHSQVAAFHMRLVQLHGEIAKRRERRARERQEEVERIIMKEQDMLLGTARAHDTAGDLERAVVMYERLMQTEDFEPLWPLLKGEINGVKDHLAAVQEAESLALADRHAEAIRVLKKGCPRDPREHLLPFQVASYPSGARVTFPNGEVRTTPFVARSGPGEQVSLRFEAEGFQPRAVRISDPGTLAICLHAVAERRLAEEHRVQALPVPVGDDHVVADRKGRVLRLDAHSSLVWSRILDTLGGVARTPVHLPQRPGHLLVVSEDGRAWLVDSSSGKAEGPIDLPAAPSEGPALTRQGVWLRMTDKRIAIWQNSLQPTYHDPGSLFLEGSGVPAKGKEEAPATITFLRRNANGPFELSSTETSWTIRIRADDYLVVGPDGKGFTAERKGDWTYVAWEAPKALLPRGRVWVSDGAGLRCYRPDRVVLQRYP